ncbi:MAG: tetratricopeptide repeat protein [candidate division Zixibacteria bacterium]|nr:tetratricopeptide repeat protein [candidate division Zixibacteria bacterium]
MINLQPINSQLTKLLKLVRTALTPNDPPRVPESMLWVIKQSREMIDSSEPIATVPLIKLGNIEFGLGEKERAERYFAKAVTQAEVEKAYELVAVASVNLGVVLLQRREFVLAEKGFEKALGTLGTNEDHILHTTALINIGIALKNQNKLKGAHDRFTEALVLAKRHDFQDAEAKCWINFSYFDYADKNYLAAIEKLRLALDLYAITGNSIDQIRAYYNIGLVFADAGDFASALKNLERAQEIASAKQIEYGDNKIASAIESIRERQRESMPTGKDTPKL